MRTCQFPHAMEETGGMYKDATSGLHDRLHDNGSNLTAVGFKRGGHLRKGTAAGILRCHALWLTADRGRRHANGVVGQRAEDRTEAGHATDADRAEGVTVIGLADGKKPLTRGLCR